MRQRSDAAITAALKALWHDDDDDPRSYSDEDMNDMHAALAAADAVAPPDARIEALEAPHTDRHTPCPKCGHVITHVERQPLVVGDEGGEGE